MHTGLVDEGELDRPGLDPDRLLRDRPVVVTEDEIETVVARRRGQVQPGPAVVLPAPEAHGEGARRLEYEA